MPTLNDFDRQDRPLPRVRFDRNELAGSFGDIGTDLPLIVAMIAAAGLDVDFVRGDARKFRLGRRFKLIFMAFNSLQHLGRREDLEGLFSSVKRHLAPGDGVLRHYPLLFPQPCEAFGPGVSCVFDALHRSHRRSPAGRAA